MRAAVGLVLMSALMFGGCDGDGGTSDGGTADSGTADSGTADAGSGTDGGATDAGASDAGTSDAGTTMDAGSSDSGTVDAGPPVDAGMCVDPPSGDTRPSPTTCSDCRRPGTGTFSMGDCATDADCTEGVNGRCVGSRVGGVCSYDECFSDSDCESNELCACDGGSGGGNACIMAGCRTNVDCGGFSCAPTLGSCGNYLPPVGYFCHSGEDECQSDDGCDSGDCRYDPEQSRWACSDLHCVG